MTYTERPARLLVVEDDDDIRALFSATLHGAGYRPQVASSGQQALDQAGELVPDLVISDVSMPGLSGLDVCRALKAEPRTAATVVLLISALCTEQDREAGLQAGADDYLTKPIRPAVLVERVRSLLGALA
ncbi:MAG TPA: response regulator [Jatrophihabitans sp.]|jgi:DNA-binding response OmpR family regulator|uniref:response regulator transcription factor n=1 Tax=Jatrophihabitans sp. TaxID=1932789 RepID=UPI002EE9AF05